MRPSDLAALILATGLEGNFGPGKCNRGIGSARGLDLGHVSEFTRPDAEVYHYNVGNGKVLKKVGFEHFATLKYGVWKNGKLADLELWGIVRPGL